MESNGNRRMALAGRNAGSVRAITADNLLNFDVLHRTIYALRLEPPHATPLPTESLLLLLLRE
jgi:hypothetical protein